MANTNTPNNPTAEIIDRKEAARILGVSLTQIERFRRQGKLPFIKMAARCVRYRRSDCEKLLQSCTVRAGVFNN